MSSLGPVRARKMFGGWGISCDGLSVALIAWERLYLKVDAQTKPAFAQADCEPFVYEGKNKPIEMSYWTVPPEAMDAPHLMAPWARLAMEAALRAANARATKTTSGRNAANASGKRNAAPGKTLARKTAAKAKKV
jgi:DNA transformation protein